ncbi:MAG: threonine synthase [Bacteroidota bacterium]
MKYYSTNNRDYRVSLREAVVMGLAPDKGLFMPERFPVLTRQELESLRGMGFAETALLLSERLFGEDIPEQALKDIVEGALQFDIPVKEIKENIYCVELFHGPTLAFKDVGARFMARMLGWFTRQADGVVDVLVATSGDTGSAVANGFHGVEGVRVHVLYPSGKVSSLQEKQFTTLGGNITALEVDGTFDDCQRLVKEAFTDPGLRSKLTLTSANSINLARFIPQSFYYFEAWKAFAGKQVVFSVPSGNFGNLTAGLLAREMGLPVDRFLAATNINDIVPAYLASGVYSPRPSVSTVANAMDVGDPSNFIRIRELFGDRHERMIRHISGYSYTDDEIRKAVGRVFRETGYVLDPHGATGFLSAERYLEDHPGDTLLFLETAHPAKFPDIVEAETVTTIEIPDRLAAFAGKQKVSVKIGTNYQEFRSYLDKL